MLFKCQLLLFFRVRSVMIFLLPEEIVLGWRKQLSVSINLCKLTFNLPLFPVFTSYLFWCSLDSPCRMFFIIIKMLQTSNKNKILRAVKEIKRQYRENKIRMTADVLSETMQVRRPWSKSLKESKENKKSVQNYKSCENVSQNWRWNTFSDIQKVKQFISSRTTS